MKLILQAIQALMRKLETAIRQYDTRINAAQASADTAAAAVDAVAKTKMNKENAVCTGSLTVGTRTGKPTGLNSATVGTALQARRANMLLCGRNNAHLLFGDRDYNYRESKVAIDTMPKELAGNYYYSATYTFNRISGEFTFDTANIVPEDFELTGKWYFIDVENGAASASRMYDVFSISGSFIRFEHTAVELTNEDEGRWAFLAANGSKELLSAEWDGNVQAYRKITVNSSDGESTIVLDADAGTISINGVVKLSG